jgi:hypothetical protein
MGTQHRVTEEWNLYIKYFNLIIILDYIRANHMQEFYGGQKNSYA